MSGLVISSLMLYHENQKYKVQYTRIDKNQSSPHNRVAFIPFT